MIAYLEGEVLQTTEKNIILKIQQIGYHVHLTKSHLNKIEKGQSLAVYIYHNIKEDISDLYGFTEFSSLELFKTLISVNGIGPKAGMEILNFPVTQIKDAIFNADEAFICQIPGIGKKTAQRLILELKGKVTPELAERTHQTISNDIKEEATEALLKLGFAKHKILNHLNSLEIKASSAEELITNFIKNA